MPDVSYRTGQAAKALGLSSYQIRRLAECGLIDAEFSGKQWRIPTAEIDRLIKDGVPEIPANSDEFQAQPAPPPTTKPTNGLTENLLKRRRLELELQEVEDQLYERDRVEAERQAEKEKETAARLAEERASQQREEWWQSWEEYGLNRLPYDAPPKLRLLARLDPIPSADGTQRIVDAIVDQLVAAWKRGQQIEDRGPRPHAARGGAWILGPTIGLAGPGRQGRRSGNRRSAGRCAD